VLVSFILADDRRSETDNRQSLFIIDV